jgi:hypothetical protein
MRVYLCVGFATDEFVSTAAPVLFEVSRDDSLTWLDSVAPLYSHRRLYDMMHMHMILRPEPASVHLSSC